MKVLSYNRITEQHRKEHIEQEFNPATIIPKVEEVEIKPKPYKLLIDYGKPMEEEYKARKAAIKYE